MTSTTVGELVERLLELAQHCEASAQFDAERAYGHGFDPKALDFEVVDRVILDLDRAAKLRASAAALSNTGGHNG